MINTRLSMGIHILSLVALSNDPENLNSEWIATSINTNPVVVRRLTSSLKKANLVKAYVGNRGLQLMKEPEDISLLEILKAVDPNNHLFHIHQNSNIQCTVGRNIESTLGSIFNDIQKETEWKLANLKLDDVMRDLESKN
ncbi:DNA-binding IscR family transcriptional regulator [Lysinibacillus composti]|uniref:Rrf2 family transcriptional regulator n=1 Tax=Lysinibacillus composti TaxID=720633 RepID=A0A3N9UAB7_9BACI|nr:Rrf2 family transcriptional regulator [Lysinibacillus composti]MBM7609928.1 DNA-binding IscR family transcriptional regulator [Lysinibacillus composti]RQW73458.1 Rrf2 family transcriptional regulator [Lysinibacillus composti]